MSQYGAKNARRDFELDISRGKVDEFDHWHFAGVNTAIGTSIEKLVEGGTLDIPTAVVTTVDVASSSANDDGDPTSNTGAQTIIIVYLTTAYAVSTKTIIMNGTAQVAWTSADFFKFLYAYVATTGTGNTNAGNITISDAGQSKIYGYIKATEGASRVAFYTVPAGKTLYVGGGSVSGGDYADKVVMKFWTDAMPYDHTITAVNNYYCFHSVILDGNTANIDLGWIKFPEKSTIYATVIAVTTGAEKATLALKGILRESVDP